MTPTNRPLEHGSVDRKEATPWLDASGPCRERCKACWKTSRVGFVVPDTVWAMVVPDALRDRVLCLACFAEMADERGVEWDRRIEFFPVSLVTALGLKSVSARGPG